MYADSCSSIAGKGAVPAMVCPKCGNAAGATDRFCEKCGTKLGR
jgi:predicted amidophosphoribosyltransferase